MREKLIGPSNGTGRKLREEGGEKGKMHKVVFLLYLAAGNIDDVTKRLKGEEGYTDGQEDI